MKKNIIIVAAIATILMSCKKNIKNNDVLDIDIRTSYYPNGLRQKEVYVFKNYEYDSIIYTWYDNGNIQKIIKYKNELLYFGQYFSHDGKMTDYNYIESYDSVGIYYDSTLQERYRRRARLIFLFGNLIEYYDNGMAKSIVENRGDTAWSRGYDEQGLLIDMGYRLKHTERYIKIK
jgi:antitoxin component YwqK of YwqJK toxin-antitoxin module